MWTLVIIQKEVCLASGIKEVTLYSKHHRKETVAFICSLEMYGVLQTRPVENKGKRMA